LDRTGVIDLEPQLAPIADGILGGVSFPDDECGDSFKFCSVMSRKIVGLGGKIRTGVRVQRIIAAPGRVIEIDSSIGRIAAQRVVVTAGVASPQLIRSTGQAVPVRPAKGYSLTIDIEGISKAPQLPIIDELGHIAITRLGSRLRLAGTVEFAGMDSRIEPHKLEKLRRVLAQVFPDLSQALMGRAETAWTGLRPVSVDGIPFIGCTRTPGLYINTGHGHSGWTLAVGSAELLADLITGQQSDFDGAPYDPLRPT
jgi:D-amino-acid dehydrogenase